MLEQGNSSSWWRARSRLSNLRQLTSVRSRRRSETTEWSLLDSRVTLLSRESYRELLIPSEAALPPLQGEMAELLSTSPRLKSSLTQGIELTASRQAPQSKLHWTIFLGRRRGEETSFSTWSTPFGAHQVVPSETISSRRQYMRTKSTGTFVLTVPRSSRVIFSRWRAYRGDDCRGILNLVASKLHDG